MPTIGFTLGTALGATVIPLSAAELEAIAAAEQPAPVRDFLLEDNNELAVRNGDFAFARGAAAVPQGIRVRIGMLLGECFLDQTKGTDWLGQILIKNPDPNIVRELLREQVLDTPDVTDAFFGDLVPKGNRVSSIAGRVNTIYSVSPFAAEVTVTE